jgi:hypothetical protein
VLLLVTKYAKAHLQASVISKNFPGYTRTPINKEKGSGKFLARAMTPDPGEWEKGREGNGAESRKGK